MPGYEDIANDFLTQAGHVGAAVTEVTALAQNQILKPGAIESIERQVLDLSAGELARLTELRDQEVSDAIRAYHQAPDPRSAGERTADEAKLARLISQVPTRKDAERYMDRANRAESVGAYQEALVYAQAAEAKGVTGAESLVNYLSSMLDMTVPERREARARQAAAVVSATTVRRAILKQRAYLMEQVVEAYKAANDYRGVQRAQKAVSEASMSAKISAFVESQETGRPYVEPSTGDIWAAAGKH